MTPKKRGVKLNRQCESGALPSGWARHQKGRDSMGPFRAVQLRNMNIHKFMQPLQPGAQCTSQAAAPHPRKQVPARSRPPWPHTMHDPPLAAERA